MKYSGLNKACPKYSYLLQDMNRTISATERHEFLSIMDAFSSYNQIKMYQPNEEKTAFVIDHGVHCYIVMSFGLKNAEAAFQRLLNIIFRLLIGQTMEVYVTTF